MSSLRVVYAAAKENGVLSGEDKPNRFCIAQREVSSIGGQGSCHTRLPDTYQPWQGQPAPVVDQILAANYTGQVRSCNCPQIGSAVRNTGGMVCTGSCGERQERHDTTGATEGCELGMGPQTRKMLPGNENGGDRECRIQWQGTKAIWTLHRPASVE